MLKEGYDKVICLTPYVPSSYRADAAPTFRQDQVCSKSPIFGDGQCSQADLILIEDIKRAPEDVLSRKELFDGVR
jgi:hypothetical protein